MLGKESFLTEKQVDHILKLFAKKRKKNKKHLTTENISYSQDLSIISFIKTKFSEEILFVEKTNQDITVNSKFLKATTAKVNQLIRGSSNSVYWYFFFEKLNSETMLYVPKMYNTSDDGYVCNGSAKDIESLSSINDLKEQYQKLLFKPNFKGAKNKEYENFVSGYINGDLDKIKNNCKEYITFGALYNLIHKKSRK